MIKTAAKIYWSGDKFKRMIAWHAERNLKVDLGDDSLDITEVAAFNPRGTMCDIFYFDNKADALMFKMIFGGDRV